MPGRSPAATRARDSALKREGFGSRSLDYIYTYIIYNISYMKKNDVYIYYIIYYIYICTVPYMKKKCFSIYHYIILHTYTYIIDEEKNVHAYVHTNIWHRKVGVHAYIHIFWTKKSVYKHTYMQIYEYTKSVYMHTYVQTYEFKKSVYMHTYKYMNKKVCVHAYIHTNIMYLRACVYTYTVYIYVWLHNLFSLLLKLPQFIKIGMDWQFRFFGGLQLRS